jgi:hypothetical protein
LSFRNPPAVSGVELPNVGWAAQDRRATLHNVARRNAEAARAWAVSQ